MSHRGQLLHSPQSTPPRSHPRRRELQCQGPEKVQLPPQVYQPPPSPCPGAGEGYVLPRLRRGTGTERTKAAQPRRQTRLIRGRPQYEKKKSAKTTSPHQTPLGSRGERYGELRNGGITRVSGGVVNSRQT